MLLPEGYHVLQNVLCRVGHDVIEVADRGALDAGWVRLGVAVALGVQCYGRKAVLCQELEHCITVQPADAMIASSVHWQAGGARSNAMQGATVLMLARDTMGCRNYAASLEYAGTYSALP